MVIHEIRLPQELHKFPEREIKFPRNLSKLFNREIKFHEKKIFSQPRNSIPAKKVSFKVC